MDENSAQKEDAKEPILKQSEKNVILPIKVKKKRDLFGFCLK